MDFCNVARLEPRKPRSFQIHHALSTRANARTCKTIDVIFAIRMARHLRKHFRNRRRLHLVLGRKAAAIPDIEICRIEVHLQKELAFGLTATFNTALA